ncbi:hypothetical protein [Vreelandella sp. TE19]
MRNYTIFITLASSLTISTGAHASNNPAQHGADCTVKRTLAYQIMNNRLDGEPQIEAERGLIPDSEDKTERMLNEVVKATYEYDIENGSVEDFEETIYQECMTGE